jgi:hypothetical protein
MALSCHGFREYVSYLEVSGNMRKRYNTSVQGFPNRMTVYFNMLRFFFDKSVEFIKKRKRGATFSTQGVYKGARGGGRREKENQKN